MIDTLDTINREKLILKTKQKLYNLQTCYDDQQQKECDRMSTSQFHHVPVFRFEIKILELFWSNSFRIQEKILFVQSQKRFSEFCKLQHLNLYIRKNQKNLLNKSRIQLFLCYCQQLNIFATLETGHRQTDTLTYSTSVLNTMASL